MSELWGVLIGVGIIALVEVVGMVSRSGGFRAYCEDGVAYCLRGGQRFGLISEPPAARQPVKRKLLKNIKDL